jgi:2-keto-4-pentenoate hydratase/2-oxohepta-3-ene-1,7-dioic acid hydratase in catechol pathway
MSVVFGDDRPKPIRRGEEGNKRECGQPRQTSQGMAGRSKPAGLDENHMRFCRFLRRDGLEGLGLWTDQGVVPLEHVDATLPPRLDQLMAMEQRLLVRLSHAAAARPLSRPPRLLPPVERPEKVICIGLNYRDHAAESGMAVPSEPIVFSKFPSALSGPGDEIVLPSSSTKVDYEAELVVVIGREARRLSVEQGMDAVFGYCCGNDVSARDWQLGKPGGQWLMGKTFDGFAPIGPFIVHKSQVPEPGNLRISMRLNGETVQDSNTSQMIFSIPEIVSYLSQGMTLRPGDLIFTGTPPGVGMGRNPPRFLQAGDECEVEIEGLGVLRNRFVSEATASV